MGRGREAERGEGQGRDKEGREREVVKGLTSTTGFHSLKTGRVDLSNSRTFQGVELLWGWCVKRNPLGDCQWVGAVLKNYSRNLKGSDGTEGLELRALRDLRFPPGSDRLTPLARFPVCTPNLVSFPSFLPSTLILIVVLPAVGGPGPSLNP